jgi:hypothetical protein
MRRLRQFVALLALSAMINVAGSAPAAGDGEGDRKQRGRSLGERRGGKDFAGSATQWSADPELGWVRTNERRRSREHYGSAREAKPNSDKPKGKGKGRKF